MKTIPLSQGRIAMVDDADFERVNQFKWSVAKWSQSGGAYALRRGPKTADGRRPAIFLHRFVLDAPDGLVVDHIDGNGLNCQRANLRICTQAENQRNRTVQHNNKAGIKGVRFHAQSGKWQARITVAGKERSLGLFDDKLVAADAYRAAAALSHGQFSGREKDGIK